MERRAPSGTPISRRELLKRALIGGGSIAAMPALLAACGPTPTPAPSRTPASYPTASPSLAPLPTPTPYPTLSGGLTVGSLFTEGTFYTGPTNGTVLQEIVAAFAAANPGLSPQIRTFEQTGMGLNIQGYLSQNPDDVFAWFAGYRSRRSLATQLLSPLDSVWARVAGNFPPAVADAVRSDEGVCGIPTDFGGFWAFFYRKSVWAAHGYQVPRTWHDLLALCAAMRADKLTPVAFGDRDGWPAMGTFDMLDLRLNGYRFHTDLLGGKQKWTDGRVIAVFDTWRALLPYTMTGSIATTWQQATAALVKGTAAMLYIGSFVTDEIKAADPKTLDDIDCFEFPYFGNEFDAERTIEAPLDIWVMPAKSRTLTADRPNAEAFLEFVARGSTQLIAYDRLPSSVPIATDADPDRLDRFGRKGRELIAGAAHVTSFFDRDSRPEFAGPQGMQSFLFDFVSKPGQDLRALTRQMQSFWDSLGPEG